MSPFFLITLPRSRGDLLVRILDSTPGVKCVGESGDVLIQMRATERWRRNRGKTLKNHQALERFSEPPPDANTWAAPLLHSWVNPPPNFTHFGVRDTYLANHDWGKACSWWSWMLGVWPGAKIVFLRRDFEELEISLEHTLPMWIPSYGSCPGCCLNRARQVGDWMTDFNTIHPERTVILESSDLLDFDKLRERLELVDIPVTRDAWDAQIQINRNSYVEMRPKLVWPKAEAKIITPTRMSPDDPIPWKRTGVLTSTEPEHQPVKQIEIEGTPRMPDAFYELHPRQDNPKLSISLMVHSSRREWTDGLIEYFGNVPVSEDSGTGRADMIANGYNAWSMFDPAADYHVVIQDDAIPCADFLEESRRFLSTLEGPTAVSFYYGAGKSYTPLAKAAVHEGYLKRKLKWGPAICLPTAWIPEMLEFYKKQTRLEYDARIGDWLEEKMRLCVHPIPSLVNHQKGKSLIGNGKDRQASLFRRPPEWGSTMEEVSTLPDYERAVVYPWLSTEATWEELRYSLRSVETYLSDKECPIFILGDQPPSWYIPGGRVRFIHMDGYDRGKRFGLRQARQIGLQLARKVLWMNDDIYLLQPVHWPDFEQALRGKEITYTWKELVEIENGHRKGMGRAVRDLLYMGLRKVFSYCTHTPMLFDREESRELMRRFHIPHSGGHETLHYNWFNTPHKSASGLSTRNLPARPANALFLNHAAATPLKTIQDGLTRMFPDVMPWESDPYGLEVGLGFRPVSALFHGWFDYRELYRQFVDNAVEGGTFVELGVWCGKSLGYAAEYAKFRGKKLKLHGYDQFLTDTHLGAPPGATDTDSWIAMLKDHMRQCDPDNPPKVVKMTSWEAAALHPDKSVDALWIDAGHSADDVYKDIMSWLPKMKANGLMGGHDADRGAVIAGIRRAGIQFKLVGGKSWLMTGKEEEGLPVSGFMSLVVADPGEDLLWVDRTNPKKGRLNRYLIDDKRLRSDAAVFLHHIVEFYEDVRMYEIFLNARPLETIKGFRAAWLTMPWEGYRWYSFVPPKPFIPAPEDEIDQAALQLLRDFEVAHEGRSWLWSESPCFVYNDHAIQSRPVEWWAKLRNYVSAMDNADAVMARVWSVICG